VVLEVALVGGVQSIADIAREVDVGRRDQRAAGGVRLDRDDALERMLRPLRRLPVADQVQDLIAVGGEELALQRRASRGKLVPDPMARRKP
jgi:hypothetical protein